MNKANGNIKEQKLETEYLEFSNKGEVPVNAFKLLGASSKRDDNTKIGYFGTGLKYALAVLLRENIAFYIYSGTREIKVGTRKTKFLDRDITVITVNGEKTSITIEAGINWEPWFAIREIYSNNLDENGTIKLTSALKPEAGQTKIYITKDEKLKSFIDNWSSYFSNTRTILSSNEDMALLQKNDHQYLTVFRRGIQAYTNRKPSLFDYDVKNLQINESRVVMHDFEARQRSAETLATSNNKEAIEKFIACDPEKYIEKDSDFWTYLFDDSHSMAYRFSAVWLDVLKDKRIVPMEYGGFYGMTQDSVALPEKLCRHLYKAFDDRLQIMGTTREAYVLLDDKPTAIIEPAMQQLAKVGFDYPIEKVRFARFKDNGVLGHVDNGLILLSEKLDSVIYQNELLETLFEEVAHAKTGYSDNTRQFQDYVIKLACALIKAAPQQDYHSKEEKQHA